MDGTAILWEADSGKEIRRLKHSGGVRGAAVSPDGKRILTAGWGDRCVHLWDLGTGMELKCFEGHAGAVLGVAFSADGTRAISCDSRNTVRLWDLPGK
jgi:WD40 repeat protein